MNGEGTIRAFVAFEMPEAVRERIRGEQKWLKRNLPRARWTQSEGQHLTLKFLGETPPAAVTGLTKIIADRVKGLPSVTVRLSGAGFFPNQRRQRVAWVGGEAVGGREVAAAVEAATGIAGFPPERRPWSLHLTQARLTRPWPRAAVETFLEWGKGLDLPPFKCSEVVIFRSELRPSGAVYTALERIPLA